MEFLVVMIVLVLGVSATFDIRLPPDIVEGPAPGPAIIYKEGDDLNLTCVARGYPQPCISWERRSSTGKVHEVKRDENCLYESSLLSTRGRDTYLITNATSEFGAYYRCKATNNYGMAVSNWTRFAMADLYIPMSGSMEIQEKNTEGDNVVLSCPWGVKSTPSATYRWMRSSSTGATPTEVELSDRVVLDLLGKLHLLQVTSADVGPDELFTCRIRNDFLHTEVQGDSYKIDLTPGEPHLPDEPPTSVLLYDKNVTAGDTLRLQCIYSGRPIPSVSWKKDGHDLTEGRYHTEQGGTVLVISDARGEDSGVYECVGFNRQGKASHELNIMVYERPYFVERPTNVNITEGATVTFRCRSHAVPSPVIRWYIDGSFVNRKAGRNIRVGTDGTTLTVSHVIRDAGDDVKSDLMTVQCSATNLIFREGIMANAYLNVLRKTVITRIKVEEETNRSGRSAMRFNCVSDTDDSTPASIEWRHDDHVIRGRDGHMTKSEDGSLLMELFRHSAQLGGFTELVCPSGTLSCHASNGYSSSDEKQNFDDIRRTKKIDVGVVRTATMHIYSGDQHGEVFIPCGVIDCDPKHIEWLKDDKPLTTLPPGVLIEDDSIHILAGTNETLGNVIGLYTCVVTYWRGRVVARSNTHLVPGSGNFVAAPSTGGEDDWKTIVKKPEFLYITGGVGLALLVMATTCTTYMCYRRRDPQKSRGRLGSDVIALQGGMQTPADLHDRYTNRYTIPLVENNIYDTIHDQDTCCQANGGGTGTVGNPKWTDTVQDRRLPPISYEEPRKDKSHPSPPSVPPPFSSHGGAILRDNTCREGCEQYEKMGHPQQLALPPFPELAVGVDCGLVQNGSPALQVCDNDPAMAGYMPMRGRSESVFDTRQI